MARKVTDGPKRNKERTKQKLIAAVGQIIEKTGPSGLGINNIAKEAGCDKKLIYLYFENLDNLFKEYIKTLDIRREIINEYLPEAERIKLTDKDAVIHGFLETLQNLVSNESIQKLIVWELSDEKPEYLQKWTEDRNIRTAHFVQAFQWDTEFLDPEAMVAMIIGAYSYMCMHSRSTGLPYCNIDITKPQDKARVDKTVIQLMQRMLKGLD